MHLCALIGLLGFSVQFDLETRAVALDNTDNTLNPATRSGTQCPLQAYLTQAWILQSVRCEIKWVEIIEIRITNYWRDKW